MRQKNRAQNEIAFGRGRVQRGDAKSILRRLIRGRAARQQVNSKVAVPEVKCPFGKPA